jgi:hypothetical protein
MAETADLGCGFQSPGTVLDVDPTDHQRFPGLGPYGSTLQAALAKRSLCIQQGKRKKIVAPAVPENGSSWPAAQPWFMTHMLSEGIPVAHDDVQVQGKFEHLVRWAVSLELLSGKGVLVRRADLLQFLRGITSRHNKANAEGHPSMAAISKRHDHIDPDLCANFEVLQVGDKIKIGSNPELFVLSKIAATAANGPECTLSATHGGSALMVPKKGSADVVFKYRQAASCHKDHTTKVPHNGPGVNLLALPGTKPASAQVKLEPGGATLPTPPTPPTPPAAAPASVVPTPASVQPEAQPETPLPQAALPTPALKKFNKLQPGAAAQILAAVDGAFESSGGGGNSASPTTGPAKIAQPKSNAVPKPRARKATSAPAAGAGQASKRSRAAGTKQKQSTLGQYAGLEGAVAVATRLKASAERMALDVQISRKVLGSIGKAQHEPWGRGWFAAEIHTALCPKADKNRNMQKGLAVLQFIPDPDQDHLCIALTHMEQDSADGAGAFAFKVTGGAYSGLKYQVTKEPSA